MPAPSIQHSTPWETRPEQTVARCTSMPGHLSLPQTGDYQWVCDSLLNMFPLHLLLLFTLKQVVMTHLKNTHCPNYCPFWNNPLFDIIITTRDLVLVTDACYTDVLLCTTEKHRQSEWLSHTSSKRQGQNKNVENIWTMFIGPTWKCTFGISWIFRMFCIT